MGLYIGNNKYKVMIGNQKCSFVTEDSLLPAGYVQLEYIIGNNSYIETHIDLDVTDYLSAKVMPTSSNISAFVCTEKTESNSRLNFCNSGLFFGTNTVFNDTQSYNLPANILYQFVYDNGNASILNINTGMLVMSHSFVLSAANNPWRNINIGRQAYGFPFYTQGRIYEVIIKKNNIKYAEFIPCKNPNNVVGMYDIVNDVFYSSSSGTQFIAGPVVNN